MLNRTGNQVALVDFDTESRNLCPLGLEDPAAEF